MISFTVPLVPPSVNMYARHSKGRHYVTREAQKFKEAVAVFARGKSVNAESYEIEIGVFLGRKGRGDIDNFPKCVLDGLVSAGVISSDAKVDSLTIKKGRDWANPRTEIIVRAI